MTDLNIVILAAGDGTRMQSSTPKLLHQIAGGSIISHVLRAANSANATKIGVVCAPDKPLVNQEILSILPDAVLFEQTEALGTGHAAKCAEAIWQLTDENEATAQKGFVAFVYGDHPLLTGASFQKIVEKLEAGWDAAVLGFEPDDPTGYGRLVIEGENLLGIIEQKDASDAEKKIGTCNACILAFSKSALISAFAKLDNDNAQKEYYLTDLIKHVVGAGGRATFALEDAETVAGVNSKSQLAEAENVFQNRLRQKFLAAGVTLRDPASTYFSFDTQIEKDVTIEQNVVIARGCFIRTGAHVKSFSHFEGAEVGQNATIGPFARLRPGAKIMANAHVGNFSELKNAVLGEGAKVNHLSYIGDATVGAKTNIGAGTITCNYDGVNKHKTEIGAGVFVGSNTALVAPVSVGDGAMIAAGSTITRDIEAGDLALARTQQVNKPNYAERMRARAEAFKKKSSK